MGESVPYRLKKFPLYHGMLVHFTVFVGDDGVPDFKVVNENNRRLALRQNLCHLCGEVLGRIVVFIGGPVTIEQDNKLFYDGPMHEDCAKYAAAVCPFLSKTKWKHSEQPPKHLGQPGLEFTTNFECKPDRPAKMALYYTRSYEPAYIVLNGEKKLYILAGKPIKIDWETMPHEIFVK